jgi:cytochrome c556
VWTEVSFDVAAKKASQALRENAKELKQLFNVQAEADGGQAKEKGGSKESS